MPTDTQDAQSIFDADHQCRIVVNSDIGSRNSVVQINDNSICSNGASVMKRGDGGVGAKWKQKNPRVKQNIKDDFIQRGDGQVTTGSASLPHPVALETEEQMLEENRMSVMFLKTG